jgi:hypothetical protein
MPLLLYGLPFFVFEVLHGGQRPSIPLQYQALAAALVAQWIAYGCGIACLRALHTTCPPPGTRLGRWITEITTILFFAAGGVRCCLCLMILCAMTFGPW